MLTVKNWGYFASLGHFEIVAAENGEKPKSDISITCLIDSFTTFNSKYVSGGGKYQELVKISYSAMTVYSKSKMAPNDGQ